MTVQAKRAQVKARIPSARIWPEHGDDPEESDDHEEWLTSDADAERADVGRGVDPEDAEEESSERVEHLSEEVPPKPDIRRQIG